MWKLLCCLTTVSILSACAHRGATRVDCEGPLRPINTAAAPDPVQVTPTPTSDSAPVEKQP